jgi:hypothetical protein
MRWGEDVKGGVLFKLITAGVVIAIVSCAPLSTAQDSGDGTVPSSCIVGGNDEVRDVVFILTAQQIACAFEKCYQESLPCLADHKCLAYIHEIQDRLEITADMLEDDGLSYVQECMMKRCDVSTDRQDVDSNLCTQSNIIKLCPKDQSEAEQWYVFPRLAHTIVRNL